MEERTLQAIIADLDGILGGVHPAEIQVYKKPFLFYQISLLKKHNVTKVLLLTRQFGRKTLEFISKNFEGFPIDHEWLAGPLKANHLKAIESRLDDVFFITRHDRFLPIDYYLLWRWFTMNPAKMLGAIVVSRPADRYPPDLYGDLAAKLVRQYNGEKRNLLDYGVSIVRKQAVLDYAGDGDLPAFYNGLAEVGGLGAFLSDKHFFDATEDGLKGLKRYLLYSRL